MYRLPEFKSATSTLSHFCPAPTDLQTSRLKSAISTLSHFYLAPRDVHFQSPTQPSPHSVPSVPPPEMYRLLQVSHLHPVPLLFRPQRCTDFQSSSQPPPPCPLLSCPHRSDFQVQVSHLHPVPLLSCPHRCTDFQVQVSHLHPVPLPSCPHRCTNFQVQVSHLHPVPLLSCPHRCTDFQVQVSHLHPVPLPSCPHRCTNFQVQVSHLHPVPLPSCPHRCTNFQVQVSHLHTLSHFCPAPTDVQTSQPFPHSVPLLSFPHRCTNFQVQVSHQHTLSQFYPAPTDVQTSRVQVSHLHPVPLLSCPHRCTDFPSSSQPSPPCPNSIPPPQMYRLPEFKSATSTLSHFYPTPTDVQTSRVQVSHLHPVPLLSCPHRCTDFQSSSQPSPHLSTSVLPLGTYQPGSSAISTPIQPTLQIAASAWRWSPILREEHRCVTCNMYIMRELCTTLHHYALEKEKRKRDWMNEWKFILTDGAWNFHTKPCFFNSARYTQCIHIKRNYKHIFAILFGIVLHGFRYTILQSTITVPKKTNA